MIFKGEHLLGINTVNDEIGRYIHYIKTSETKAKSCQECHIGLPWDGRLLTSFNSG